ncbi:hypothetical protein U5K01_03915 [Corynebacterium pseudotuberculosis]|uniref:hypothetical protein n=1 Tax=Corynebacterium pseudotuberculosis TaxID=1719 RepID=UPI002ADDC7DC|nr:hypothetical protein [Corynebacterium pseudotuberculosis]MEA1025682.1 hypothetical protein [Corynebacterium pseudotuberculosis]
MTKMALCAEITVMNTGGGNVVLSPSNQVLARTEGIQFGLDSAHAGIFPAPRELIDALVPILRSLREPRAKVQVISELTSAGLHPVAARGLMEDLLAHGVLRQQSTPYASAVIGDDPLANAISNLLKGAGVSVLRSTHFPISEDFMEHVHRRTLVIVCNPKESCVEDRINTHGFLLPVALIDAHGMIGPVRIAGSGPCLACSDLYRTDADPEWPALRTQSLLSSHSFSAEPHLITATAAHAIFVIQSLLSEQNNVYSAASQSVIPGDSFKISAFEVERLPRLSTHPRCPFCWDLQRQ